MRDIEHWQEDLAREKELVVDRRKATRYLNQCYARVYTVHQANAMKKNWRDLCACVFHYDYFPVASFFLLSLLLLASSTSRQARQPSSHMCRVSLSLSLCFCWRFLSSNAQPEQQANELIFFLVLFLFFFLFTPVFYVCSLSFYCIHSSSTRAEQQ